MFTLEQTQPINIIQQTHQLSILTIRPERKVLLVRSENEDGSFSWKLPHYDTVLSERHLLQDEAAGILTLLTNQDITGQGVFYLGVMSLTAVQQQHLFFHKVRETTSHDFQGITHDFSDIRWVSLLDVREGIRVNHITDAPTIGAITKASVSNVL